MNRFVCEGCGAVTVRASASQKFCSVCSKAQRQEKISTLRSGRRTSAIVRRKLEVMKPDEIENEMARLVLRCYGDMSEAGKEGLEEIVVTICDSLRGPFGEVGALELIGTMVDKGIIDAWMGRV